MLLCPACHSEHFTVEEFAPELSRSFDGEILLFGEFGYRIRGHATPSLHPFPCGLDERTSRRNRTYDTIVKSPHMRYRFQTSAGYLPYLRRGDRHRDSRRGDAEGDDSPNRPRQAILQTDPFTKEKRLRRRPR